MQDIFGVEWQKKFVKKGKRNVLNIKTIFCDCMSYFLWDYNYRHIKFYGTTNIEVIAIDFSTDFLCFVILNLLSNILDAKSTISMVHLNLYYKTPNFVLTITTKENNYFDLKNERYHKQDALSLIKIINVLQKNDFNFSFGNDHYSNNLIEIRYCYKKSLKKNNTINADL